MTPIPLNPETAALARRIVWFDTPEDALADPIRFMAYVLAHATIADLAIVRRYRAEERVVISSFDHRLLRRVAAAAPDMAILAIYHARLVDPVAMARAVPTENVDMEIVYTTAEDVRACHDAGLAVTVGGLGSEADFAQAARLGADGVTLDDPRWAHGAGADSDADA